MNCCRREVIHNDSISDVKSNRIQKSFKSNSRHKQLGEFKFEIAGMVRLSLRTITKESCIETLLTTSVSISLLHKLCDC